MQNLVLLEAKGTEYQLTYFPLGQPEFWRKNYASAMQAGHLKFIVGEGGAAHLLSWQSRRLRRVARSAIAAETLAAMTACESALLMPSEVTGIMK